MMSLVGCERHMDLKMNEMIRKYGKNVPNISLRHVSYFNVILRNFRDVSMEITLEKR
jgi:hypothetical protein